MKTSKEPETEIQGNRHVKIERQNNNKYKEDRDVFDNQSVFGSLAIAYCLLPIHMVILART